MDYPFQLLGEFSRGDSWFAPWFGYAGNIAFFIPFGVLLYCLLCPVPDRPSSTRSTRSTLALTVLIAALTSIVLEAAQYAFSLGFTDIDDVLMNTIGALVGGLVAVAADKIFGRQIRWFWIIGALLLGAVFAVLVGLGERLGDPNKVVEVN